MKDSIDELTSLQAIEEEIGSIIKAHIPVPTTHQGAIALLERHLSNCSEDLKSCLARARAQDRQATKGWTAIKRKLKIVIDCKASMEMQSKLSSDKSYLIPSLEALGRYEFSIATKLFTTDARASQDSLIWQEHGM